MEEKHDTGSGTNARKNSFKESEKNFWFHDRNFRSKSENQGYFRVSRNWKKPKGVRIMDSEIT